MKTKSLYLGFVVILFAIGFFLARMSNDEAHLIKRSRILLGTVVEIRVKDKDSKKAETAIEKSFREIKRIDDLFSTYNRNSPVWKLNHNQDTLINVDPEIFSLMVLCDSIYNLTYGSFDVSLNKLLATWGFDGDDPTLPADDKLRSTLLNSGWNNIELLEENSFNRTAGTELNFGAIAKGYAIDKAVIVLKNIGINDALVNAGGEIKTIGNNWIIGIQHPREPNQVIETITPGEMSVATSGDYEKHFIVDGKRYHHILNPKTGYPADSLISVTVLNKSCTIADALATAVFVLGLSRGLELIENLPETEVMIIDNQMNKTYSSDFEKFISRER
ncbi:MAG: FAD:protein FMN transferase [Ignavibacteria bacterium]|nr:FAD:protein FMN transferase [Ignavibacteria bacterium]